MRFVSQPHEAPARSAPRAPGAPAGLPSHVPSSASLPGWPHPAAVTRATVPRVTRPRSSAPWLRRTDQVASSPSRRTGCRTQRPRFPSTDASLAVAAAAIQLNLSGTAALSDGSTVTLTGTWDTETGDLDMSGGGYTFNGVVAANGSVAGTWSGPSLEGVFSMPGRVHRERRDRDLGRGGGAGAQRHAQRRHRHHHAHRGHRHRNADPVRATRSSTGPITSPDRARVRSRAARSPARRPPKARPSSPSRTTTRGSRPAPARSASRGRSPSRHAAVQPLDRDVLGIEPFGLSLRVGTTLTREGTAPCSPLPVSPVSPPRRNARSSPAPASVAGTSRAVACARGAVARR